MVSIDTKRANNLFRTDSEGEIGFHQKWYNKTI